MDIFTLGIGIISVSELTCVLEGTTPAVEIFTLGIGIISVSELDKLNYK